MLKKTTKPALIDLQSPKTSSLLKGGRLIAEIQQLNPVFKAQSFLYSLSFAFEGLVYAFKTERNFRIHLCMGAISLALGFMFQVSPVEWAILWGIIGIVLFAELANTILEVFVDLLTEGQYDHRAKVMKDMAAGSVLVVALSALAIGVCIFMPHIIKTFYALWPEVF